MKKTKLLGLAKGKESFGDYKEPAKVDTSFLPLGLKLIQG